jgi:hypothetical protein
MYRMRPRIDPRAAAVRINTAITGMSTAIEARLTALGAERPRASLRMG